MKITCPKQSLGCQSSSSAGVLGQGPETRLCINEESERHKELHHGFSQLVLGRHVLTVECKLPLLPVLLSSSVLSFVLERHSMELLRCAAVPVATSFN